MIEFFNNCWEYVVSHKDYLITFLTSAQFAAIVTLILNVVRQGKSIKANSDISKDLNTNLVANVELKDTLSNVTEKVNKIVDTEQINKSDTDEKIKAMSESLDGLMRKLNSVLEVQSIVYSTIKDEEMRTTVNNLLNNARYAEGNIKNELEQRMEQLEADIKAKMEDVNNTVKDTIENVKSTVSINVDKSTTEKSNIRRY